MTPREQLKSKVAEWISTQQVKQICDLMLKMIKGTQQQEFTHVLSKDEASYVMGQLAKLMKKAQPKKLSHSHLRSADKDQIRDIIHTRRIYRYLYSNIISENSESLTHAYSNFDTKFRVDTDLHLTAKDYENLIEYEVSNKRFHLGALWFQRFESQFPNGSHYSEMTHNLWQLRFFVFGRAFPSSWPANDQFEEQNSRMQANSSSWVELFEEYSRYQHLSLGSSKPVFDNEMTQKILLAIAFAKNVNQLTSFIELTYGIDSRGKVPNKGKKLLKDDPQYPDTSTLEAIFISCFYNRLYGSAMAYINAFQEHYGIVVGRNNLGIWDKIFNWAERSTRYTESLAFLTFIRGTMDKSFKTVIEAMKSPDFDYEGYLKYRSDLHVKRYHLINEFWKKYLQNETKLIPRACSVSLSVYAGERLEKQLFAYLKDILLLRQRDTVSTSTFNDPRNLTLLTQTRELYINAMIALIKMKCKEEQFGQLDALINKWSLDEPMTYRLQQFAQKAVQRHERNAEKRKAQQLAEEQLEDDENFLGLID